MTALTKKVLSAILLLAIITSSAITVYNYKKLTKTNTSLHKASTELAVLQRKNFPDHSAQRDSINETISRHVAEFFSESDEEKNTHEPSGVNWLQIEKEKNRLLDLANEENVLLGNEFIGSYAALITEENTGLARCVPQISQALLRAKPTEIVNIKKASSDTKNREASSLIKNEETLEIQFTGDTHTAVQFIDTMTAMQMPCIISEIKTFPASIDNEPFSLPKDWGQVVTKPHNTLFSILINCIDFNTTKKISPSIIHKEKAIHATHHFFSPPLITKDEDAGTYFLLKKRVSNNEEAPESPFNTLDSQYTLMGYLSEDILSFDSATVIIQSNTTHELLYLKEGNRIAGTDLYFSHLTRAESTSTVPQIAVFYDEQNDLEHQVAPYTPNQSHGTYSRADNETFIAQKINTTYEES
ncbi:MAG: hypothetical protein COZ46_03840 [Verrucomicrobia bacterium CG_4_10_14_3_um_filter_43_23]|nr:MAG: hypothetical protein AUJ82_02985 [Verrucomicrobia bacterium CG1_02_43_26]PIP59380.1 MAG: hypothetical protein COX01_03750 [Verrucomicrobia bacterium CG22_combo_CG10-13_8_21_14_all_43_17]PIX58498.1 MAG: hypothetical protein COZ46_03840 [Verrucomicrobia bacterium CG_4_10_14_3_um_filter_43_23]PIY62247.1 MAG: hypothetical protein COY94_02735 [Verrucomicrobia bacterium CG_4_10_14_0_8_um_filter_43_34]PJA44289.1 MAG: hypothetical protein CO175_03545 [Verrucomicrobia bacterium CG_4_9_14_3_um_fi